MLQVGNTLANLPLNTQITTQLLRISGGDWGPLFFFAALMYTVQALVYSTFVSTEQQTSELLLFDGNDCSAKMSKSKPE